MKSPDENPLLQEILADEKLSEFRRVSLNHALVEMRHARQRRRVARIAGLALLPLALIAMFVWFRLSPESVEPRVARIDNEASSAVAASDETPVPTISDEELFALFPNRALALIGSPGRQQLIFLDAPLHN